ncbi:hypothetical protein CEXT_449341 [Caerostris extrusa]|uniref:Uncharacterized protein n=1 Tax=Caerostris extrusa TaxID=172846 RepID=A0AAV4UYT4_CAEEX|nr:hypothetical protein CEXT_449341 [Caerostris extrusa]
MPPLIPIFLKAESNASRMFTANNFPTEECDEVCAVASQIRIIKAFFVYLNNRETVSWESFSSHEKNPAFRSSELFIPSNRLPSLSDRGLILMIKHPESTVGLRAGHYPRNVFIRVQHGNSGRRNSGPSGRMYHRMSAFGAKYVCMRAVDRFLVPLNCAKSLSIVCTMPEGLWSEVF